MTVAAFLQDPAGNGIALAPFRQRQRQKRWAGPAAATTTGGSGCAQSASASASIPAAIAASLSAGIPSAPRMLALASSPVRCRFPQMSQYCGSMPASFASCSSYCSRCRPSRLVASRFRIVTLSLSREILQQDERPPGERVGLAAAITVLVAAVAPALLLCRVGSVSGLAVSKTSCQRCDSRGSGRTKPTSLPPPFISTRNSSASPLAIGCLRRTAPRRGSAHPSGASRRLSSRARPAHTR